ncbi:GNAT family N-acetyltransferase [Cellulomonas sp. URHB0016]
MTGTTTGQDAAALALVVVGWDDPDVARLRDAQQAELRGRYGDDDIGHEMTGEDIVAVVLVRVDGEAVAVGALRDLGEGPADDATPPGTGELKRMYVVPEHRGRGYSRLVLAELERQATRLGLCRLILETGVLQPEAIGLYLRSGYLPIDSFGEYVDVVDSRCFEKRLAPAVPRARSDEGRPPLVTLDHVGWDDPEAVSLRRTMWAWSRDRYADFLAKVQDGTGFDDDDARQGVGVLSTVVARVDGRAVGCASLRAGRDGYPEGSGELKKLFVDESARGAGAARALLAAVESDARGLGLTSVVLQTGIRQPEAVALYVACGYRPVVPFGPYQDDLLSLCFAKTL